MSEFLDETIMHKNTMNHIKLDGASQGMHTYLIDTVVQSDVRAMYILSFFTSPLVGEVAALAAGEG